MRAWAKTPEQFWALFSQYGKEECWPWPGPCADGEYPSIMWRGIKSIKCHRVAYELANNVMLPRVSRYSKAGDMHVLHRCDNPPCCNPGHLFLGTPHQNALDAAAKGRTTSGKKSGRYVDPKPLDPNWEPPIGGIFGSAHHKAKLTEADIPLIRARREAGEHLAALAKEYGVSVSTICGVAKNLFWRHVIPKQ